MTRDEDAEEIRVLPIIIRETVVVAMVHDEVLELEQFALVELVEHFENRVLDCLAIRLRCVFRSQWCHP